MSQAGIPTIIYGPGSIEQAHTADEFIEVAQIVRASRVLCETARLFANS
jgi:acetylornithine deacetylase/succinyl-diaminopimelate desuccinylase-like protein